MIETEHLTKHYGSIKAVNDISFQVQPGEVLGFLGPNGAGKSTTMKMLAGFVEPTRGRAMIYGKDVSRQPLECKAQIGYLPEGAPSYGEMTPLSFLNFIADVRNLSAQQRGQRIEQVVDQLNLEDVLNQSIETLSKGFKRRVGLAQAILHDPSILILDEPTDGLDPNQKHEVRQLISRMAKDKIIIISTHILEEVTAVCTRAIIIARGELLADETPQALQAKAPYHNRLLIKLADQNAVDGFQRAVKNLKQVKSTQFENGVLLIDSHNGINIVGQVTALAQSEKVVLSDVQVQQGQLDDVFREITQHVESTESEDAA